MCACPLLRLELSSLLQKFVEIRNKSGKIRENRHNIYFVPAGAEQSGITSASDMLIVTMNLQRDFGNTEHNFRDAIQLYGVNILQVMYDMGELTSPNAAPNFMTFSKPSSVNSFISGE